MTEQAQIQFKNLVREALNECFSTMTQEQLKNAFYSFDHLQEELLAA
ncbi:MAG: hypothetical protein RL344_1172 [Pseudomonadota bacterium]|jgi:hypothetical protein